MSAAVYEIETISKDVWQKEVEQFPHFLLSEAVYHPDEVQEFAARYPFETCLYWGDVSDEHASISPYLLPIAKDWSEYEQELITDAHWGVVLALPADKHELDLQLQTYRLLHHLRQWSLIERNGERQLLRISNWEVLKTLLEASNTSDAMALLGPIESCAYFIPGSDEVSIIKRVEPVPEMLIFQSPRQLSSEQNHALELMAQKQQYRQYIEHLYQHHTDCQKWNEDTMMDFVLRNIETAKQFDFSTENDLVRYLSLAVVFGDDFYKQSWAKHELDNLFVIGAKNRMDRLYDKAIEASESASS